VSRCSIIIPIYNQASLTRRCLNTLLANPPKEVDWEIIVVDDGSTDGSEALLLAFGDQIRVIKHDTNDGFATACNHGASVASGEYLVFLNNDTIPTVGWLDALVRHAEEFPQAAVVGSKLLFPNLTIQHAGVVICQDHMPRHLYTGFPAQHPAVNQSRRFQAVTAACMLVRRALFEQAKGFDTGYRNGFEDIDLCLRLGEQGCEIHYCHESVLYHLGSVSPGRFQGDKANTERFCQRWKHKIKPDDVGYYLADGLLDFNYAASYPVGVRISPLLARVDGEARRQESEQLLNIRTEQVSTLLRENIHLLVQLGGAQLSEAQSGEKRRFAAQPIDPSLAGKQLAEPIATFTAQHPLNREAELHMLLRNAHAQLWQRDEEILSAIYTLQAMLAQVLMQQSSEGAESASPAHQIVPTQYMIYQEMIRRMRYVVDVVIPVRSTVAVMSKGDDQLLGLGNRQAWHFPQNESGGYAGHYPQDSAVAIAHLEAIRRKGAEFLLIPRTSHWWLDYYVEFKHHLEGQYRKVMMQKELCVIYALQQVVARPNFR
jgi:GT2 family glycosyltransferase